MSLVKSFGRSTALAILSLLAIVLSPLPAAAEFGKPINVSPVIVARGTEHVQIAASDEGAALALWVGHEGRFDAINARLRSSGGVLGPTLRIGDHNNFDAATSPNGDFYVVWSGGSTILGRAVSAGGVLGPVETLYASSCCAARDPDVEFNGNGDAVVAWLQNDLTVSGSLIDTIGSRIRRVSGALTPLRTLSGTRASRPRVASSRDGDATIIWRRPIAGTGEFQVEGRQLSQAGVVRPGPVVFSHIAWNTDLHDVGADAAGNALVAWVRTDAPQMSVKARTLSSTGVLGPLLSISPGSHDAHRLQLAVSPGGVAYLAWENWEDHSVWTRVGDGATTGGAFSALRRLTVPGEVAGSNGPPALEVDGDGTATAAWTSWIPQLAGVARMRTRSISPGGILGLIDNVNAAQSSIPRISVSDSGNAALVWEHPLSPDSFVVQMSVGP